MTKGKSIFKLIVAETTGFALNFVPLALWFFEDYSYGTVVLLYLIECVVTAALLSLCLLLLAPAEERVENITLRRKEILSNVLLIIGPCSLILAVLILAIIFVALKGSVPLEDLKTGLMIVLAFQLFEFFANLYLLRPLSLKEAESLLGQSMSGIPLLIVSILLGGFVAVITGQNYWFMLVFVIFKTLIDVLSPIQFLRGKQPEVIDSIPNHPAFKYKARGKWAARKS